MKKIIVTLRSRKGTEWQMETLETKIKVMKINAKNMGYEIVKIEKVGA